MTERDKKNGNRKPDRERGTEKPFRTRRGRILRWCAVLGVLVFLAWLASWLGQRSLATPAKKRAMQSWLDENLNADVSLLGGMTVRLNLVRNSRLVFHNTEVEHPNPVFPGKFARIGRMGAWASPFAMAGIVPGVLDIRVNDVKLDIEQGENGEWSLDGLMRPLASGETPFPFLVPKVSRWKATVENGALALRRRGYELTLDIEGEIEGRPGGERIAARAPRLEYAFGSVDAEPADRRAGSAGPVSLTLRQGAAIGDMPAPVPGRCEALVENLPVSALPFFLQGIPMDGAPGVFNGLLRYDEHPGAAGALFMEGELKDVPLGVFGLPRNAPLRLTWPLAPTADGLEANVHMGPSGYGAFGMTVSLDEQGAPRLLSMRGDVAALDDIPAFFTMHSRWPDWLSRAFPRLVWRTGSWRGFGWRGSNLVLELSRSMAGLTLNGEGEMFGGKIRLAMTPDQADAPITVAAERLDAAQLSARLSQSLPEPFRANISGGGVNLTWRGFPSGDGSLDDWGAGMVWAKPLVDLRGSGEFWRSMAGAALPIADAMPRWGGGATGELLALAEENSLQLDQLSIVSERDADGSMLIEFRAYGGSFGQVTGVIERRADGAAEGEFLLAGASRLLEAVARANPDFAKALDFLANGAPGLRVSFVMRPDGGLAFTHHFLEDARRVHEEVRSVSEADAEPEAEAGTEAAAGAESASGRTP